MGPHQKSVPRTPRVAKGVDTVIFLFFSSLILPVANRNAAHARFQQGFASAFIWIEDEAVNHHGSVLAKSEFTAIAKTDLQTRLGSRAKLIIHMRKRADGGGLIFNLRRANHFGGHPHSAAIRGEAGSDPAQQKTCANRDGDCQLAPPIHAAPRGLRRPRQIDSSTSPDATLASRATASKRWTFFSKWFQGDCGQAVT